MVACGIPELAAAKNLASGFSSNWADGGQSLSAVPICSLGIAGNGIVEASGSSRLLFSSLSARSAPMAAMNCVCQTADGIGAGNARIAPPSAPGASSAAWLSSGRRGNGDSFESASARLCSMLVNCPVRAVEAVAVGSALSTGLAFPVPGATTSGRNVDCGLVEMSVCCARACTLLALQIAVQSESAVFSTR
jgi:hypothetical protein